MSKREDIMQPAATNEGGDSVAFASLMRRHNRRLFRVARIILS